MKPNRPRVQFVTVNEGVSLEVLDRGGTGSPQVWLAGSGNTAHVFDGFVGRLVPLGACVWVIRRSFGRPAIRHPGRAYGPETC